MMAREHDLIKIVNSKLREADDHYDTDLFGRVEIRCDILSGRKFGQARMDACGSLSMRFLGGKALEINWDKVAYETVPHEVAHIVCFVLYRNHTHNRQWQTVCRLLGGSGSRTGQGQLVYKGGDYVYLMPNGDEVGLSKRRHNMLQRGGTLRHIPSGCIIGAGNYVGWKSPQFVFHPVNNYERRCAEIFGNIKEQQSSAEQIALNTVKEFMREKKLSPMEALYEHSALESMMVDCGLKEKRAKEVLKDHLLGLIRV